VTFETLTVINRGLPEYEVWPAVYGGAQVGLTLLRCVERQAREGAVLALWEGQELTIREAAEELGLTYAGFLDLLAERGIPVVRGPLDLKALEEAEQKLAYTRP
jgi:hypothetical protein